MKKILAGLKMNEQQTAILIILVTLIVLIAYINFALRPQVTGIARVFVDSGKMRADLKNAETLIGKMGEMKASIEAYEKKVGRYEKTLPTEQGLPGLLENLSEMAKSSNMKIVGIVPAVGASGGAQRTQAYQETPIMITARSGYHELGRFLSRLENCDRFMKVADISILSNRASPKRHDVELLVLTYVLLGGK